MYSPGSCIWHHFEEVVRVQGASMGKPAYPEILTSTKWDKEKGILAKVFKGETGVGAALIDLKKHYDEVPWDTLDEKAMIAAVEPGDADKLLEDGKACLNGPIETARKKAVDASRVASKAAEDMKKVLLAPKSTREYLTKMSNAAVNFSAMMRDEATETLKKFQEHRESLDTSGEKSGDEVRKSGEAYISNRKLALSQMNQLKNLFMEARTRINMMSANAEKMAKEAVATPTTAVKAVNAITALHTDAEKVLKNAKDRYAKDGSVNTNAVQRMARGNIAKVKEHPEWTEQLTAYQTKSRGDFNTIMAIVAEVLRLESELEATVSGMSISLEIAKDASTMGTKTLVEHQNSAKKAVISALDLVGKVKIEVEKIVKRIPMLELQTKDALTNPGKAVSVKNVLETSVTEIERRVGTMLQLQTQVEGYKRRLSVLPPNIQNDGVIKGEVLKLEGIIKNFQAVIKQSQESLEKARALYTKLEV
jgi:hypothetical protein